MTKSCFKTPGRSVLKKSSASPSISRNYSASSSLCWSVASAKTPLMESPWKGPAIACLLWLSVLIHPPGPAPAAAAEASPSIIRHDLFVELDPERHALIAVDRMTVNLAQPAVLQFSLAPTLHLDRLRLSPSQASLDESSRDVEFAPEQSGDSNAGQRITIPAASFRPGMTTITASYQ